MQNDHCAFRELVSLPRPGISKNRRNPLKGGTLCLSEHSALQHIPNLQLEAGHGQWCHQGDERTARDVRPNFWGRPRVLRVELEAEAGTLFFDTNCITAK